jgi:hypothetical protein
VISKELKEVFTYNFRREKGKKETLRLKYFKKKILILKT